MDGLSRRYYLPPHPLAGRTDRPTPQEQQMEPMTPEDWLRQFKSSVEHVKANHPARLGEYLDAIDTAVHEAAAEGRFKLTPPTKSPAHVVEQ